MEQEVTKLKGTKDVGRVTILKAMPYMKHQVVVRRIGKDYFEYLFPFEGQIYSSYIIIKPAKGKRKLTKEQVAECRDLIWSGAEATLDTLLGIDTVGDKKEYIEKFEKSREQVENKKDGKN